MAEQSQYPKRNIAYKYRIGALMEGNPVMEGEKLKHVEVNGQEVVRVNLIANVVDKYIQEGEKKFGSITIDDGTGQIKGKVFGEEVEKLEGLNQGDTILAVGLLRSWNNETYLTPEILKKKDPSYLLIRKLEAEKDAPKPVDKEQMAQLKDTILTMIKDAEADGGVDQEKLILDLKEHTPDLIKKEIKKLLEDGIAYEPRPGKIRYLG